MIDRQLSSLVGARVEISGEVEPATSENAGDTDAKTPTLRVESVKKIASTCP